ncbi:MAG TPA: VWA domain-containing protein [Pyrinomonadaceae bacterium]|nr:VWA domain-containing protein [Pyrinomonadaceae bacterium]
MHLKKPASQRLPLALVLLLLNGASSVHAQQSPKPTPDDVVRVNTELVQSAVTVLDKDGHFVDGLNKDQFQLLVDGQPRAINLFDRVTAGSPRDARLTANADTDTAGKAAVSVVRGRTIVFFVDDMHMSAESFHRTRDMLRGFLTNEMSMSDSVIIATASGQMGFLEQFTNNKQILATVVDRLSPQQYDVRSFGSGSTRMREYDALMIDTIESKKANSEVLNYYIRECIAPTNPPGQVARAALAMTCETDARNSARAVLMQAAKITQNMYATLESIMRAAARSPGRKLAFFVSDGFLLDAGPHAPDLRGRLDGIIDAAQRAGVVVYTIDSRGLTNDRVDMRQGTARLDVGAPIGEAEALQNAMNALAGDTGGRALRNTNFFDRWVGKVLDETSNYYLLAWRPDRDVEKTPKFKQVQISIVNRPNLIVRAPRGYLAGPTSAEVTAKEKLPENHAARTPETELRDALADYRPSSGLPTFLSLAYLNTPKNEMLLTSSFEVSTSGLDYGEDGKQPATVRIAGVILNEKGKAAGSFKTQLNVTPRDGESLRSGVIYNERTVLTPGIYQVRAVARDERSRRIGSAIQWIMIPALTSHQLTASSILLGAQVVERSTPSDTNAQVQLNVNHRFARRSPLGYWIFVYNAKRGSNGAPSLTVHSAVLRDGLTVLNVPDHKISASGDDPDRIAFGETLPLASLAPGSYELLVTVKDELSGTTTSQEIDLEVYQ